jgi:tetratricopeptide (TPR) repeat protein
LLALLVSQASAQVGAAGTDTTVLVADPGDVLGSARAAQADFERFRERHLPFRFGSAGGPCDEVVGRLCTWYGEGEWRPTPDPAEVVLAREELVDALDSLQRLSPGDGWILAQRVWYRGEGGDWDGALATTYECRADPWWCAALEGLALHGLGRYDDAEDAFRRALERMDGPRAREWRMSERVGDRDAREWLRDREFAGPDSLAAGLDLLWRLADPLYLVAGNDRHTEHYARWTVATLKEEARNPFRMSWGEDLEELTVRHGWEIGWERSPARSLGGPFTITGHKHPEAREYLPSGATLAAPAEAAPDAFLADRRRPRSLYAPVYAPIILPMDGQVAVFRRTEGVVVVATAFLPMDTSFHATHEHERPWMEPGSQAGMPDRIGLFAVPVDGGRTLERTRSGSAEGAVALALPARDWVLSAESWSPELRRAGRQRQGLAARPAPPDIAVLSDLLLLSGGQGAPASLEAALPSALRRLEVLADEPLAVAWEVAGLGFRAETLVFELSVDRTDRNVLRRIGEFLGLSDRPPSLSLSWEETGPTAPTHVFRHLELDLPPLDPGLYEITLTLRTTGRSDAVSRRAFTVVQP